MYTLCDEDPPDTVGFDNVIRGLVHQPKCQLSGQNKTLSRYAERAVIVMNTGWDVSTRGMTQVATYLERTEGLRRTRCLMQSHRASRAV